MRNTVILGVVVFLVQIGSAWAQFTVALQTPLYGQATSYYCGAASSQMIMNAYPNAASRVCTAQTTIYNTIQTHKQDNGFYSDPDGLRDTIMQLNPPPAAGHFVIFSDTNSGVVMHDMLYWMAQRNYPSATLINGGDHWVVVSGYQTDIDPRTGNALLQTIDVNDPLPVPATPQDDPCTPAIEGNQGGTVRHVAGSSWFSNDWKSANKWGTKWLNDFVAVVEPPQVKGRVTARMEVEEGRIISADEALKDTMRHLKERKLAQRKQFGILRETLPKRALLANREHKAYYIIPFESRDRKSPAAMLLNAYTGEFEEVAAFPHPVEYLSRDEAIKIALCSTRIVPFCTKPTRLSANITAELVYKPSEQVKSRYFPVWQVTIPAKGAKMTRYISQLGEVFIDLTPLPYGGD
jgi:hypothetical protein